MKRFWLGFVAGALVTSGLGVAWLYLGFSIGSGRFVHDGGPLVPLPQFIEASGLRVAFGGADSSSVVVTRGTESFTFTPPAGEVCDHPVVSPDGHTLFLLAHSKLAFGYDYSCILRFDLGSAPLSGVQPQRILTQAQLNSLFGGKRSWVNSLYKVSASGDRLLLNISTEDTTQSSGTATYYFDRPYWYDLNSNSIQEPNA